MVDAQSFAKGVPNPDTMDPSALEKRHSQNNLQRTSDMTNGSITRQSSIASTEDHEYTHVNNRPTNQLNRTITTQSQISRNITRYTTQGTTFTSDPSFEVDFEDGDPEDPRNWSVAYKGLVICCISFSTLVVVLYSTSYTSAIGTLMQDFGVSNAVATLGLTTYLIGLAVGSVVLAPLSETYGRKPVYVIAMFCFTVLVIPTARATDITTLIVVRFFGAVAGSAMIANGPGTIGDIVSDEYRAMAFSIFAIGPMNGPVVGPVYGGFVTQYLSWRWANWIVMILGGVAFLMMLFIRETYTPILLQHRAASLRKKMDENRYWSQYDIRVGLVELLKVNLSRPFIMAVTEPICIFWNIYIGVVYAILYLCFASYPIVYREERGWSLSISSLSFCGIGVGIMFTICMAKPIKKMIDSHKHDEDGNLPPESMMSVVCIAAVAVPAGELWFAWTCLPASIHPAVAIAAGIPFGAGNAAIFIYASNYLVGSYGIYAASALAGNSVIRSVLGGTLPLAGPPLYRALGANWAGTLLGLLEVLIIPVPFIFYRYGHKIREKSSLIREMREIEMKKDLKHQKAAARLNRKPITETVTVDLLEDKNGKIEERSTDEEKVTQPEWNFGPESTGLVVEDVHVERQAEVQLSRVEGLDRTEKRLVV